MKTGILSFLVMGLALVFMCQAQELKPESVRIPGVTVRSVSFDEKLGLYEVVGEAEIFYLTRDGRYAIVGNVFEVPSMRNLTELRKEEVFKVDFSGLPLSSAVRLGTGKTRVAVFSSPNCPWCRKLHAEIKKVKDVSFYIFVVPFGSQELNAAAACGGSEMLERAYSGEKLTFKGDCSAVLKRNAELMGKLGVTAFPTLVFESGRKHTGFLSADEILRRINGG